MASLSNFPAPQGSNQGSNRDNPTLSECTCPICMYILIEPVTLPCNHTLCMPCFQQNVQEVNLCCPLTVCRLRISAWARRATKDKSLVDQSRWKQIKEAFPQKVKNRMEGKEDSDSEEEPEDFHIPVIAVPGEIGEEYKMELQKFESERQREKEKEEEVSRILIDRLQAVDEVMRQEEEGALRRDEELARKIAAGTPVAVKGTPKPTLLDRFVSRNTSRTSTCTSPSTTPSVYDPSPDLTPRSVTAVSDSAPPSPPPVSPGVSTSRGHVTSSLIDNTTANLYDDLTVSPCPTTSSTSDSTATSVGSIQSVELDKGLPLPRLLTRRSESPDSLTLEMCHFKPIHASPKTPTRHMVNGKPVDPPVILSTPRNLSDLPVEREEKEEALPMVSPVVVSWLQALARARNEKVASTSKCLGPDAPPLPMMKHFEDSSPSSKPLPKNKPGAKEDSTRISRKLNFLTTPGSNKRRTSPSSISSNNTHPPSATDIDRNTLRNSEPTANHTASTTVSNTKYARMTMPCSPTSTTKNKTPTKTHNVTTKVSKKTCSCITLPCSPTSTTKITPTKTHNVSTTVSKKTCSCMTLLCSPTSTTITKTPTKICTASTTVSNKKCATMTKSCSPTSTTKTKTPTKTHNVSARLFNKSTFKPCPSTPTHTSSTPERRNTSISPKPSTSTEQDLPQQPTAKTMSPRPPLKAHPVKTKTMSPRPPLKAHPVKTKTMSPRPSLKDHPVKTKTMSPRPSLKAHPVKTKTMSPRPSLKAHPVKTSMNEDLILKQSLLTRGHQAEEDSGIDSRRCQSVPDCLSPVSPSEELSERSQRAVSSSMVQSPTSPTQEVLSLEGEREECGEVSNSPFKQRTSHKGPESRNIGKNTCDLTESDSDFADISPRKSSARKVKKQNLLRKKDKIPTPKKKGRPRTTRRQSPSKKNNITKLKVDSEECTTPDVAEKKWSRKRCSEPVVQCEQKSPKKGANSGKAGSRLRVEAPDPDCSPRRKGRPRKAQSAKQTESNVESSDTVDNVECENYQKRKPRLEHSDKGLDEPAGADKTPLKRGRSTEDKENEVSNGEESPVEPPKKRAKTGDDDKPQLDMLVKSSPGEHITTLKTSPRKSLTNVGKSKGFKQSTLCFVTPPPGSSQKQSKLGLMKKGSDYKTNGKPATVSSPLDHHTCGAGGDGGSEADPEVNPTPKILDRSCFTTDAEYKKHLEEQDRLLALQLQADFDLEARLRLTAIRRKGTEGQYEFRRSARPQVKTTSASTKTKPSS